MSKIKIQILMDTLVHGDLNELQCHVLLNEIQYMRVHHMRKINPQRLESWLFEGSIDSSENFNIENDEKNAHKIMEEIRLCKKQ